MKRAPEIGRLRGKTRAGRLDLWDALLNRIWPHELLQGMVEVGVGERPDTALALADAVPVPLTVVELHPTRANMMRTAVRQRGIGDSRIRVVEEDALQPVDVATCGVLRCANVLRQYPADGVDAAHRGLVSRVRPGGVVLEGSCDAGGDVGAFHVLRVTDAGWRREALVFFSSFARGFAPIQLRDWLPRDLRRQVTPSGSMGVFFEHWTTAWRMHRVGTPPADFRASAHALGTTWLDLSAIRSDAAAMVWRPPDGVPSPAQA